MSYILRHGANKECVDIDENGWVDIQELIAKANEHGYKLSEEIIEKIVETDAKQRYSFHKSRKYIRANQGHSLKVDVQLKKAVPPTELYHGTSAKVIDKIRKNGIEKMSRNHVHLSEDMTTATTVGSRHGVPVVLIIDSKAMLADGINFFKSKNGVWLVDYVDPKYFKN